ncbi:hypothetical protein Nepgr_007710 [Nepenthes gracilis]|uniref:NPH3 domain-containing protein n=1 Tax=Nepenthes gracilis TaxID=150966 RepID=A0AAD3S7H4_NEPGR|nr:hypothetical protein Nepgr_007710 [Nepenthes gracilis]
MAIQDDIDCYPHPSNGATTWFHEFMWVAKGNYIRKLILASKETDLARINLSDILAAKYLEMIERYCENILTNRIDDFLNQVALTSLSGAVVVLKACEGLLPMAYKLNIVQKCIDVISSKACSEAAFPSRTPPNWWTKELSMLYISSFLEIIAAMKSRCAKTLIIASAIITYAERSLRDLVRDYTGNGVKSSDSRDSEVKIQQRELLESIVALLPSEKSALPISFLCSLLRCAIFLKASSSCKNELEKRISATLEHVTIKDLLVLSFT